MDAKCTSREQKDSQAYNDVLDCVGPTIPDDAVYMECYRFWYPLGVEAAEDRCHPL